MGKSKRVVPVVRVFLDHQIFIYQKFGGISRYFTELMRQGAKSADVNYSLSVFLSENQHLERKTRILIPLFKGRQRIILWLNRKRSLSKLRDKTIKLFHPTYYDTYFLKYWDKPFVITVYDMINELYPQFFSSDDPVITNKRVLIEKASKVIAISHQTKNDILKFCDVPESKITVVHLATSLGEVEACKKTKSSLHYKYLLFVGNRAGYKNFNTFYQAALKIIKIYNINLVCAGGGAFSHEELEEFHTDGVGKRVFYFSIDNNRVLKALFEDAHCFVFPSLYEGFGIPALEALISGCPVALSNQGSFPEVAGEVGYYFDPESVDSIVEAIKKVPVFEEERNVLKKKWIEQAQKFSWEKTFSKTQTIYEQVVNENNA